MLRKAFLLSLALVLIPCISSAEIKTYTHTVKQAFGGSQSPDDARISAIHKAKREALEKAGTYLESLTIVKNSMVDKDEILALTAGVLKAEVVSQENFHTKDAFGIIIVAKVDVDTNILEERVKKLLQDRELLKKYQQSQEREKELLAKIESLEEENRKLLTFPAMKDIQKQEELKKQFRETTQGLTAVEWFQKAVSLLKDGRNPNQALDYLNQAIRLDPNYAGAYAQRGVAYSVIGQQQRAIEDYNHAIRLNPNNIMAYTGRGMAYKVSGQHQRAIEDYNHVIQLDPNNAMAYSIQGVAYIGMGKHQQAIEVYNKAIQLDPNNAMVYAGRGIAYSGIGQYPRAIEDYNHAIRLNPKNGGAYYNIGCIYSLQNNIPEALKYLELALQNGYDNFDWIGKDTDWDNIRLTREFNLLINKYK